jgi:hypothetical protein
MMKTTKSDGIVHKRRAEFTVGDLCRFIGEENPPADRMISVGLPPADRLVIVGLHSGAEGVRFGTKDLDRIALSVSLEWEE